MRNLLRGERPGAGGVAPGAGRGGQGIRRLGLLAPMLLAACTEARLVPPVRVLPSDAAYAWPMVLADALDDPGRVDLRRLAAAHGALDLAAAAVAQADASYLAPASAPGRADRLAFLLNASNTLWTLGMVQEGIPDRLGPVGRADVLRLARFTVAGREMSLDELQREIVMPYAAGPGGDWRVPLALYCPAESCPRLARMPYAAAQLKPQLDAAARRFLSDPANVVLEPAARVVRVSALLAPTPGLIGTLNRYRGGAPIPLGWKVAALPFDWTVAAAP